jgi:hypothetical protein
MDLEGMAVWVSLAGLGIGVVWLALRALLWLWGGTARTGRWPGQVAAPVARPRPSGVRLGPPRRVEMDVPGPVGGMRLRRGPRLILPVRHDPLWAEKGWRRNGNGHEGQFRAGRWRWRGLVHIPYPGGFEAYIWNPPLAELARRTRYRPCFQPAGGSRYKVHFHAMPTSLDHAIATVERVLAQAMGVR